MAAGLIRFCYVIRSEVQKTVGLHKLAVLCMQTA